MDFDSLVKDILNDPEIILTKNFSEDELLEIQKRINPYKSFAVNDQANLNANYKKILVYFFLKSFALLKFKYT